MVTEIRDILCFPLPCFAFVAVVIVVLLLLFVVVSHIVSSFHNNLAGGRNSRQARLKGRRKSTISYDTILILLREKHTKHIYSRSTYYLN